MRHQDLLINHILESWTFANNAARLTAGAYVSGDLGRIAYQSDTKTYWRLTGTAPAWDPLPIQTSYVTSSIPSVITTTSVTPTYVHAGCGQVATPAVITPIKTGKILAIAHGQITHSAASSGVLVRMRAGTGTPPNANAAETGSIIIGPVASNNLAAGNVVPFCLSGSVTPTATLGTPAWFDIVFCGQAAGTASLANCIINLVEV